MEMDDRKCSSEIRCILKPRYMEKKKIWGIRLCYENDTSILPLSRGGKIPKEKVIDGCLRVYFASRCGIFNSDFPHQQAVASEMIPSSQSANT